MLFIKAFDTFLAEEVNLNKSRIDTLVNRVTAIEGFITASSWQPTITRYSRQGSWAHKTIIKPLGNGGFDADVLVIVEHVQGWNAEDYVLKLEEAFNGSGTYKDKAGLGNRCVTLEYSGNFEIDIVPCVINRPGRTSNFEVCNRRDNKFEATDSEAYTRWLEQRNEWVGNDRFREVTRLLKYIRDVKLTFSCKSILLTTLIGERITHTDAYSQHIYFPDLPSALHTLVHRLDDYLQAHPRLRVSVSHTDDGSCVARGAARAAD
jgi:Second Messenger Oligonucleotide or Dinucleotide Synthetase domain